MRNLFTPNPILIQCEFGSGKVLFIECICQSINYSILPSSREQLLQVLYKQLLRLLNLLITAENSAWYPNYVCYKECLCQNCQQQAAFYSTPPLPLCNALETKQIVSVKNKMRNSWEHSYTAGTHSVTTHSCSVSSSYTSDAHNVSYTPKNNCLCQEVVKQEEQVLLAPKSLIPNG